jgi:hypothetical protein
MGKSRISPLQSGPYRGASRSSGCPTALLSLEHQFFGESDDMGLDNEPRLAGAVKYAWSSVPSTSERKISGLDRIARK